MRKETSCDTNGTDFYPDTEYEPYRGNRDPAGHFSPTFFEETAESFFLSFMGGRAFQIALSDFFLFGGFFARRFEKSVHRNVYLDVRYSDHDNICRDRVLKTASEIKDSG